MATDRLIEKGLCRFEDRSHSARTDPVQQLVLAQMKRIAAGKQHLGLPTGQQLLLYQPTRQLLSVCIILVVDGCKLFLAEQIAASQVCNEVGDSGRCHPISELFEAF